VLRAWPGAFLAFALALVLAGSAVAQPADGAPPVPPGATSYYVADASGVRGPVSLAILRSEIDAGTVQSWTLVWKPGLAAWIRADGLPEFAEALAAAAPRPPPPPPLPPGPPPVDVAEAVWFVAVDGVPAGPWSDAVLAEAITAGTVGRATLVWRPGGADWVAAADVPELAGLFAIVPPPLPSPEVPPEPPEPPEPPPGEDAPAMVGTWEFLAPEGDALATRARIAFAPDMTFAGEVSVTIPGGTTETQAISGTWAVSPVEEGAFALTLAVAGAAPSEVRFRIVDDDTLRNEADGSTARRLEA
jgi:hypothetical protein